jgi:4-aminobutyrate aminotransferase / (S)-3-amino-2-methylpropionate transaminase / 5-aminovalerate transaminase
MTRREGQLPPKLSTRIPGPRSRRLAARLRDVDCPAFEARRRARSDRSRTDQDPILYSHGKGSNVFDVDGNRYVDLVAGFGALALGHAPEAVTRAVAAQQKRLTLALGDVYAADVKVRLCEELSRLLPHPSRSRARVMLGLSGADAITAALKSALLATGKPGVVAFRGGYHGLTYAPLAACGLDEAYRAPFEAQLGKFVSFAPYPTDEAELDRSIEIVRGLLRLGTSGAVLVEPILGRGGCVVPPRTFLASLRAACDEAGALLVADEIWTGLGRSGAWLDSVAQKVVPDIVCIGKALGGGLPVSACIGSADVMKAWAAHGGGAIHTATHFASPLGCAAALATLGELKKRRLPGRARSLGERWRRSLSERLSPEDVRGVSGRGLMVGIHVVGGPGRALAVARGLLSRGYIVLTGGASGDVLTLTPALDIAEEQLTAFVSTLDAVLRHGS